jgi:hypothetical protein
MLWKTYNFATKVSWLFRNMYRKTILLIPIMTIFSGKKFLGLLGLGLKIEVIFGIDIWNVTEVNGIHEAKTGKKLRNETKFYFWRNKTKRNEISLFFLFRETYHTKFRETIFWFRFVSCFAKQKKWCEMETLPF